MNKASAENDNVTYSINYKNGASKVTTLIPVFELKAEAGDLFAKSEEYDVLLQAVDADGKVIGEPKAGGAVNPATGTIALLKGSSIKVPMQLADGFEGSFRLVLLDPATLAQLAELKLETDYMV